MSNMEEHASPLPTFAAPAERARLEDIRNLASSLLSSPVAQAVLESVAGAVLVLDSHRQIVAANSEFLLNLGDAPLESVLGKRPGEAMGCVHTAEGPGGCGTGPNCAQCGALVSILACQREGVAQEGECMLRMLEDGFEGAGEFRVRSAPVVVEGVPYTVFVLQDISASKRKEALESVFFHDILNLVGGLQGASHLLRLTPEKSEDVALQIIDLSGMLTQEILSQRLLVHAEQGQLNLQFRPVNVKALLEEVHAVFRSHDVARDRVLDIQFPAKAVVESDSVLLGRVLINMVKNALEATPRGGRIQVVFRVDGDHPTFEVTNEGFIPESIQGRIFQRSFSTKSQRGRGLGTYSMKVFGERYLGGEVGFESSPSKGTRFFLRLPGRVAPSPDVPHAMVPLEARVPSSVPLPAPVPKAEHDAPRVLVVDDSPTILAVLGALLGKECQVLEAGDGQEGLNIAREQQPDLILLDVVMPGMDGYEVCRLLKADSRTQDIPVIFLSAMTQEADEAAGLAVGAIDYITKPVSPAIVRARVRNHLELKRYRDTLKDLSMQDGLTGIANRRRFDQYFEQEWSRAQRQRWPITLMIGDVDHFKLFNDGYGHLQGDTCLRQVAAILQANLHRGPDLVARYGGEEFAILLPSVDMRGAWGIARRIRDAFHQMAIPHRFSPVKPFVTLSLGIASTVPDADSARETLLEAADQQLYQAKALGRDQFSPGAPPD